MAYPEIDNIVSICVALDIAIIGIAYPIIIDKISNIGGKYSSDYLSELFETEFPQRRLKIFGKKFTSIFILATYSTVFSFIPLIFNFKPFYDWERYWLINNSATLLVFTTSTILVILFFLWLNKVALYNHKPSKLLNYLISDYNNENDNGENYYLKTINEFAYYAIRNQDVHIQETLVSFYFEEFSKFRKSHNNSEPLDYPEDLYQLNYDIIAELIDNDKNKLRVLEHRAVSGVWILGEGFGSISISEKSYNWLWRNLNLVSEKEDFVKMYWQRAHQHYDHKLRPIVGESFNFDTGTYDNQDKIKAREVERERFIEFNYAFGGLLMFKEKYVAIKYILNHTTSHPPNYVLMPIHMTEIFKMLYHFSDKNYSMERDLEFKYPFWGLDDYWGNDIRFWINSFLAVLFVRQFKLQPFMTFHEFKAFPNLPDEITALNHWLANIDFFENSLEKVKANDVLIDTLGYDDVIKEDSENNIFKKFFDGLKNRIKDKIDQIESSITLDKEKVGLFEASTELILEKALKKFDKIQNSNDLSYLDDVSNFGINGIQTTYSKSAFTKNGNHINYNTFFAEHIEKWKWDYYIPNSFITSRSRRYLLKETDLYSAIKKLKVDSNYIIVAINASYDKIESLSEFKKFVINIWSSNNKIIDAFFVLKKADLPTIKNLELSKNELDSDFLKPLNNLIYTSVLDLNLSKHENIRNRYLGEFSLEELKKRVQITIAFKTLIIWKNQREVVQLNVYSRFQEQGIVNELKDIVPFN